MLQQELDAVDPAALDDEDDEIVLAVLQEVSSLHSMMPSQLVEGGIGWEDWAMCAAAAEGPIRAAHIKRRYAALHEEIARDKRFGSVHNRKKRKNYLPTTWGTQ